MKQRGRELSQNFLVSKQLVRKLVAESSIGKDDTAYEIGPGKGIITEELAKVAGKVIAVEIDRNLAEVLRTRFRNNRNVVVYNDDFLKFRIKEPRYKVFANIPFHIESEIVRKLIDGKNPPEDTYLVMLKDVAERLAGTKREGLFSILHKPYFETDIVHRFKKTDFDPPPKLHTVLFRAKKRKKLLITPKNKKRYENFVKQGFGGGRRIEQNLKQFFSKQQLIRLAKEHGFSIKSKPSGLSFEQWLNLFNYLTKNNLSPD